MSPQKPGWVIFAAIYLFIGVGLTIIRLVPTLLLIVSGQLPSATLISVGMATLMAILLLVVGFGLLDRQQWARVIAIVLFSFLALSAASGLITPLRAFPGRSIGNSLTFQQGQRFGQLLTLGLSSFGLYGLAFDQGVKHFFRRSSSQNGNSPDNR